MTGWNGLLLLTSSTISWQFSQTPIIETECQVILEMGVIRGEKYPKWKYPKTVKEIVRTSNLHRMDRRHPLERLFCRRILFQLYGNCTKNIFFKAMVSQRMDGPVQRTPHFHPDCGNPFLDSCNILFRYTEKNPFCMGRCRVWHRFMGNRIFLVTTHAYVY